MTKCPKLDTFNTFLQVAKAENHPVSSYISTASRMTFNRTSFIPLFRNSVPPNPPIPAKFPKETDPCSSGEDSDEEVDAYIHKLPSVKECIERLWDSRAYIKVNEEQATGLIQRKVMPVWLYFPNLEANFNAHKFRKFIDGIFYKW